MPLLVIESIGQTIENQGAALSIAGSRWSDAADSVVAKSDEANQTVS
jgi:hypothetical protein